MLNGRLIGCCWTWRESVSKLSFSKVEKLAPSSWGTLSATSGGFDLGVKMTNGYTIYYSINFAQNKFSVLLDDPNGTRLFNKGVTLS